MAIVSHSDLDFGLKLNDDGDVNIVTNLDAINQSIRTILTTVPGERINRPLFGSNLKSIVFQPLDFITAAIIDVEIREALQIWEPRITITDIKAEPNYDDSEFIISLSYRVNNTNTATTLETAVPSLGNNL